MVAPVVANAAAAYASAAAKSTAPGMEPPGAEGGGFAGMLKTALTDQAQALQAGEKASMAAIAGKANLTDVVNAVNNADVTLQAVMAVRDRMVSAYQDILRMPM